jgi:hypothetical protein
MYWYRLQIKWDYKKNVIPQTEYIDISPVLLWCHKVENIFDYQNACHDIKQWYYSAL